MSPPQTVDAFAHASEWVRVAICYGDQLSVVLTAGSEPYFLEAITIGAALLVGAGSISFSAKECINLCRSKPAYRRSCPVRGEVYWPDLIVAKASLMLGHVDKP